MLRPIWLLPTFLLLFTIGCSDAPNSAEAEAPGADSGAVATCPSNLTSWVGAYDLSFDTIDLKESPENPDMLPVGSVCEGELAHLEVRQGPEGVDAAIAFPRRSPTSMQIQALGCELYLTGNVVAGNIPCSDEQERWFGFVLSKSESDPSAVLFRAWGQGPGQAEVPDQMGAYYGGALEMTATGTVQQDTMAPRFEAEPADEVGEGLTIPWEPIRWRGSEPVGQADWEEHVRIASVTTDEAITFQSTFDQADDAPALWAGAGTMDVHPDWDEVSGKTVLVEVTAGVPDRSDNESEAVTVERTMLDVGPVRPAHRFGDGVLEVGTWGQASILSGAEAGLCEGASCLRLAPDIHGGRYFGIAGRLSAQGASRVRMRYRVLSKYGSAEELVFSVAVPGEGVVLTTSAAYGLLEPVEEQPDGVKYATAWTDLEISLPAGMASDVVGFTVSPGLGDLAWEAAQEACGHDSDIIVHPIVLLVDRVEAT